MVYSSLLLCTWVYFYMQQSMTEAGKVVDCQELKYTFPKAKTKPNQEHWDTVHHKKQCYE